MPNRNRSRGFTLIEALIVVVIIGVVSALAAPAFTRLLERNRLKGAAESVFSELMRAKSEAVKRNRRITVSFVPAADDSWCFGLIEGSAACDCTTLNSCQLDGVERVTRGIQFEGVGLPSTTFTGDDVTFEPQQGRANAGTVGVLNDGITAQVRVSVLGRVRVCSDDNVPGYQSC
ncbi:MAG: GspH/FimT family pseudopilin [Gammaproteobacteria bacterium]|nr:GspH/FimT family pseudopilin [Gammaproteobacteria bacterium]